MKSVIALVAVFSGMMFALPGLAEPAKASPEPEINFGENLFTAFSNICLANRGSWSAASKVAEGSIFKFKKTEIKKTQEVEFSAFPLEVVLKRWGKGGYACLAQSVVEGSPTAESLAGRLKSDGSGLSEVSFVPVKGGVDGTIPKTTKTKGKKSPDVMVRVGPSSLKDASTVQLLIFTTDFEPPKTPTG